MRKRMRSKIMSFPNVSIGNPEVAQTLDPRQKRSGVTVVLFFLLTLLLIAPAHADINDGLVGHWAFDEGQGTIATDSSITGHNGSLVNDTAWTTGINGNAILLD